MKRATNTTGRSCFLRERRERQITAGVSVSILRKKASAGDGFSVARTGIIASLEGAIMAPNAHFCDAKPDGFILNVARATFCETLFGGRKSPVDHAVIITALVPVSSEKSFV